MNKDTCNIHEQMSQVWISQKDIYLELANLSKGYE